jgi:hypothetical protein
MQRDPVDFLRFATKHYHLLISMSGEYGGFQTDEEIEAFIHSHSTISNRAQIVSQMKGLGILNQNTGQWALPPFLINFLISLQERHILATPEVVQAWVKKLSNLADGLNDLIDKWGVEHGPIEDESGIHLLREISDAIHAVNTTVGDNIERIGQEVTTYRNTEDSSVMRYRLRQLINLYENYLLPVMSILDVSGQFEAVSQQILALCTQIQIGKLSFGMTLADAAQNLSRQVTWLRRNILRQADEATRELAPLCKAANRESAISRGVNRAIHSILERKWQHLGLESTMAIVCDYDASLAGDDAISCFMQDAFNLREQLPPLISNTEPDILEIPISINNIRERIESIDHIDDVLTWLMVEYQSKLSLDGTVNMLFQLAESEDHRLKASDETFTYDFKKISVKTCKWTWNKSNE